MPGPDVVDLSHHNPDPDWGKMLDAGVVGVILKATESTTYKDPTLYKRGSEARKAGLKVATYHFLRPQPIKDQINHYLNVVNPVEGERMVLDHEDAGVSLEKLIDCFEYLQDRRPDVQLTLYSGHLIKEQLNGSRNVYLSENVSLWIAHYTTAKAPKWPKETWPAWSLWQYTDSAKVDGCPKPVDGNRWNGSPGNLMAWFGPASEPEVKPASVKVEITVPEGVELTVTINGKPMK